jgi:hypothetical protein
VRQRIGPSHPVIWVVGFIAALCAIAGYSLRDVFRADETPRADAPITPSPSTSATTTPTTQLPTTSTTVPATTTSFVPSRVYLTELSPVARSIDVRSSAAELGGTPYGNSLVFTCELYCDDSASLARVAYNLGGDYSTFSTTAGVLDTAPDINETATFTVIVDGIERAKTTASFRQPAPIELDIRGALRLELLITTGIRNVSPLEAGVDAAGGKTNSFPHTAWGDPLLVR